MSGQRVNKGQSVLRQRCMCVGVFLLATYGCVLRRCQTERGTLRFRLFLRALCKRRLSRLTATVVAGIFR